MVFFFLYIVWNGTKSLGEDFHNKIAFHKNIIPINVDQVDIWITLLSSKQYQCIILPKINGYTKYFDNTDKYMNPLGHDKRIVKKIQWNMR